MTSEGTQDIIRILDTKSGHSNERSIMYKDAACFIVCFALDDPESFKLATTTLLTELKTLGPKPEIPRILCGLKKEKERKVLEELGKTA